MSFLLKIIPFSSIILLVSFIYPSIIVDSGKSLQNSSDLIHENDLSADSIPTDLEVWGMLTGLGKGESSFDGSIFRYNLTTGEYKNEYLFEALTSGTAPSPHLIDGDSGNLYGVTYSGGNHNKGVLYRFNANDSGEFEILYHFDSILGSNPFGTILLEEETIYGLTSYGGSYDRGVLYSFDLQAGIYEILHEFDHNIGDDYSNGSVIMYGGSLYGMTVRGGIYDEGVIYRYDLSDPHSYTILHHFHPTTGSRPFGSLHESEGNLYGMTGPNNEVRVLFEFDLSDEQYNILYYFGNPYVEYTGNLVSLDGILYGMTSGIEFDSEGVIFSYDLAADDFQIIYRFTPGYYRPTSSLLVHNNKLYGACPLGGAFEAGVIFEYNLSDSGSFKVLHSFDWTTRFHMGNLAIKDETLFGASWRGGNSGFGAIFAYDLDEETFSVRHHFKETNGNYPSDHLIVVDGKFFGTTSRGGKRGRGVLFEYNPVGKGNYRILHDFEFSTGDNPLGGLIHDNNRLYGVTHGGGEVDDFYGSGNGVLFTYDILEEKYHALHFFDDSTGFTPYRDLLFEDGQFYGLTHNGGSDGNGVIFNYNPLANEYRILYEITDTLPIGGINPEIHNGILYLAGENSETTPYGSILQFDLTNSEISTPTVLHQFNFTDGSVPTGDLVVDHEKLLGFTKYGGDFRRGVLFQIDLQTNEFQILHHFTDSTDIEPQRNLIVLGDKLLGMFPQGGNDYSGLIFEYNVTDNAVNYLHHFDDPSTTDQGYGYAPGSLLAVHGCLDTIDLTSAFLLENMDTVFTASDLIRSDGIISEDRDLMLRSHETQLEKGFETKQGGKISIYNDPCVPILYVDK